MNQVLAGMRVLDFGRYISGPWCAALLGDLGAEVIRVERREGGEDRGVNPLSENGDGAMFLQCNRNKLSMTLDPQSFEGKEIKRKLVESADIVVLNLPDKTLRMLELDYETLAAIKPSIIFTNGTAYGNGGPYSDSVGYDGVGQVMSGAIYRSGTPEAPMRSAAAYVDFGTSLALAVGTLAAVIHRERTGEGQKVEGSLLGTALMMSNIMLMEQAVCKSDRVAIGNRSYVGAPSDLYRSKDGWVLVQIIGQPQFKRWCRMMGEERWLSDCRFASDELRAKNGDVLNGRMAEWCLSRTNAEAVAALGALSIPASPMLSPQQALEDPHIQAMGFFKSMDYPGLPTPAPIMDTPFLLSRTPGTIRTRAPLVGEHTDQILQQLGYDNEMIRSLREKNVI
jgi:crotonobetainyl-CoA:carnitine CoA-transferase CaiB-like acyl-CoA transferase